MKRDQMQYDVRRTRIYKADYRPSSNLSRFIGNLVSIILRGQSHFGRSKS